MMSTFSDVRDILEENLQLGGRSRGFTAETELLGALPELDSMAILSVMTSLEDRLGIEIPDDEIDGETFRTLGNLVSFVEARKRP